MNGCDSLAMITPPVGEGDPVAKTVLETVSSVACAAEVPRNTTQKVPHNTAILHRER